MVEQDQPVEPKFSVFTVRGGPSPRDLRPALDGVPLKGITGFTIEAGIRDAVKVTLRSIQEIDVSVSVVRAEGLPPESTVRVWDATQFLGEDSYAHGRVLAEATADTSWEALMDCARQLELAAQGQPMPVITREEEDLLRGAGEAGS